MKQTNKQTMKFQKLILLFSSSWMASAKWGNSSAEWGTVALNGLLAQQNGREPFSSVTIGERNWC